MIKNVSKTYLNFNTTSVNVISNKKLINSKFRFYHKKFFKYNDFVKYNFQTILTKNYNCKSKKMNSENYQNKDVKTNIGLISYLNSETAKKVDENLMGINYGYSIDQLMEVAGLSVAQAIDKAINTEIEFRNIKKILCICGPGSMYLIIPNIYKKRIGF